MREIDKNEERRTGPAEGSSTGNESSTQNREEVWSAIQAFEQILAVMPDDLTALETLWRAYSEYGDEKKSLEYLLRLGRVIEDQGDASTAQRVISSIKGAGYQEEEVASLVKMLQELCGEHQVALDKAQRAERIPLRAKPKVPDELSFAWYLMESEMISAEDYARLADDLAEMSARARKGTISVLHALEARTFPRMSSLLEYVSQDLSAPYISLKSFDVSADTVRLLPTAYIIGRGVLPFETLGKNDLLLAVLNPFDKSVAEEITKALGMDCHLYLTSPGEFDEAVKTILGETDKESPNQ